MTQPREQISDVTLPLTNYELLRRLSQLLQKELREFFSTKQSPLSNNGYVFFQLFDTSLGKVRYWYTDAFNFYDASQRQLLDEVSTIEGDSNLEKAKKALKEILWRRVPEEMKQQFKAKVVSHIKRSVNDTFRFITRTFDEKELEASSLLDLMELSLKGYLLSTYQPISLGLAGEIFDKPPETAKKYLDIFRSQAAATKGDLKDKIVYELIKAAESFFFVGGIRDHNQKEPLPSSFVVLLNLFCYGQRAGYLYIIESFRSQSERTTKIALSEEFLNSKREVVENWLMKYREGAFQSSILNWVNDEQWRKTPKTFRSLLETATPFLLNIRTGEKVSIIDHEAKVLFDEADCIHIPVNLKTRRQARDVNPSQDRSTLKVPLYALDIRGIPGVSTGLADDWNRIRLMSAFSTGLKLYGLAMETRRLARDAEWKVMFDEIPHTVNNEINAISMQIELARRRMLNDKDACEALDRASQYLEYWSNSNTVLQRLSRGEGAPPNRVGKINIKHLLRESLTLIRDSKELLNVEDAKANAIAGKLAPESLDRLLSKIAEPPFEGIQAYVDAVRVMFIDVIKNALRYCDPSYDDFLLIRTETKEQDQAFCLHIHNNLPLGGTLPSYVGRTQQQRNKARENIKKLIEGEPFDQSRLPFSKAGRVGYRVIRKIVDSLSWKLRVVDGLEENSKTHLEISIPIGMRNVKKN